MASGLSRGHPIGMFCYLLSLFLSPLYALIGRLLLDDRDRVRVSVACTAALGECWACSG